MGNRIKLNRLNALHFQMKFEENLLYRHKSNFVKVNNLDIKIESMTNMFSKSAIQRSGKFLSLVFMIYFELIFVH